MAYIRLRGDYQLAIDYDLLPADTGFNALLLTDRQLSIVRRVCDQVFRWENIALHPYSGQLGETLTDAEASAWSEELELLIDKLSGGLSMNQNANTVLAGPVSGLAAAPSFRSTVRADLPIVPSARVYNSADQAAGHNVWTTLDWASESWDTDTMHDPVTNKSRLTVYTAGIYAILFNVHWDTQNIAGWYQAICVNGNQINWTHNTYGLWGNTFGQVSVMASLSVGQYVQAQVYQSSSAGHIVYVKPDLTSLQMAWVGRAS